MFFRCGNREAPIIPKLKGSCDSTSPAKVAVLENHCGVKNYIDRVVPTGVGTHSSENLGDIKKLRSQDLLNCLTIVVLEKVAVEISWMCL